LRRILPRRPYLNIVGHKWIWFGISIAILVISIIALFTRGLNFGIDFTGGAELDIKTKPGVTISQVRGAVGKVGFGSAQIQSSGKDSFIVRTPKLDDPKKKEIIEALKKDAGLVRVLGASDVGPGWGGQVSRQAAIALGVFIFAVLIYISFRFEFKMAVCAIIEIFHDFVITIGVYSLLGRQVTPATVIAVLTILGYSLYDTIVVFDRIKENTDQLSRQSKKTYSETVNDSINQVLGRSINTSLTTLIPIVTIMLFGGVTLQAFAFALFIGVLSGTYSSIFLAPPILSVWKESEPKYRAYRERVERKQARQVRKPGSEEPAIATSPAGAARAPRPRPSSPKPGARAAVGEKATRAGKPAAAKPSEKPQPKPKPAQKAAASTSKSAAKSRTKGPGSGKKKKKKR